MPHPRIDQYKSGALKSVLYNYNKSVRKLTYPNARNMKKGEVIAILNRDFNPTRQPKSIKFKHKSGRFTKKLKYHKEIQAE